MISYEPLWNTLKEKNVSQYQLINQYKVSAGQLSRLRKNANVPTHTLDVLCEILGCELHEIALYQKELKEKINQGISQPRALGHPFLSFRL